MATVPLKPSYRPTLAELLSPRWRRVSGTARLVIATGAIVLAAALAALILTLLPARISYGGPVPFSLNYRGLHRVAPDPGGLVKVLRRAPDGQLEDSFAVFPITLPSYRGSTATELSLYAAGYIRALAARHRGFQLRGEGRARVKAGTAYNVYYTAFVEGRPMYGRDFLLLPERTAPRAGVAIVMLTSPRSNAQVTSPLLIATAGLLSQPLHSFSFS